MLCSRAGTFVKVTKMINQDTPTRIQELGRTLWSASEELERIFRALSAEADGQLAISAEAFLEAQKDRQPVFGPYIDARRELTRAAGAASNIDGLARQTNSLRASCAFWGNMADSMSNQKGRHRDEITTVCERVAAAGTSKEG
jgi:hypothetical protein